ncbi:MULTISPECIES: hypothetical protein [Exiguobacterium]|uniref:Uncharacterized protein n=1 Tax=Exiguobacterium sibiricum (strain DSM 17290 / CCUG 55495 / CIP 109462 / JCM 13490 / 255-15) TaxID=262543 RepID=B1YM44_EXIS2|nr:MULTISPECIES: hypothetical protein [Exiguobacterium]ACB62002.1 hypothetical protein Exig_2553 [Exiguobacterium sibiricum 255-15]MDW2886385.1 hypothetical protein [Exiguobacterium sibiricum]QNR22108.1 hypothetical protein HNY42_14530 [Exiguobacterium sp. Helios]HCN57434.1 hypothetical protein [Exiguobacterium sp.]
MRKMLKQSRFVMIATLCLVLVASVVTLLTLGFERDIVILVSGVVALWVTMLAPLTVQAKLNEQS